LGRRGEGGGGSGGGLLSGLDVFDADSEGCVFFLLALALVVAGTLAALYVVYAAPLLLAEILVEGVLLSGLYRGMKGARGMSGDWLGAAVRRTWLPVLLTLATFAAAGYFLERAAPRARSIGEAWKMVGSD
jgi:succinate dehydrogenase hydrophobic anchor subunit